MNVGVRIFGAQFGIFSFKNYVPIIAAVIVAARRRIEEYQRLSRMRRLVRRQRKRRDLALLKAGERARKAAARMAAQRQPHYTYLGRTNGHDVWRITGTSGAGPGSPVPPTMGAPIAYRGGIPSAHYVEAAEELNQIPQRKEREAAAPPTVHATPQAHLSDLAHQQPLHEEAAAIREAKKVQATAASVASESERRGAATEATTAAAPGAAAAAAPATTAKVRTTAPHIRSREKMKDASIKHDNTRTKETRTNSSKNK
ncbi:LOW QUALITY PROTEIN: uncharacterized protein EMH_0020250 [Eimeria mitis]|uniref:Uncharacterized protein n=1 Tax=Eimeria mitis TaxID=44415 RepID=U6KCC3_9EIME|nr:LOW QUALITY PROTEIN: uncharacterized protein EMH_0020250 [Eimeria mitis]CDJ34431.1 hypothetical protein, conserved [Eimeria mitis]